MTQSIVKTDGANSLVSFSVFHFSKNLEGDF